MMASRWRLAEGCMRLVPYCAARTGGCGSQIVASRARSGANRLAILARTAAECGVGIDLQREPDIGEILQGEGQEDAVIGDAIIIADHQTERSDPARKVPMEFITLGFEGAIFELV